MHRKLIVLFAAAALLPSPVRAQGSPIVDLLVRARGALNDLRYGEADSLAATVLSNFDARLSRDQRMEALGIAASAMYPDPAGGGTQRADSALGYLRRIVRQDPAATLRPDVSWHGLDSLFALARATTFSARARPQADNVLAGPRGEAVVEVLATRPARFRLSLVPASGGTPFVTDSAGPTDHALLRLRAFAGERPALASGDYTVEIVATDSASGEAATQRFAAAVDAPPVNPLPVSRALDSTRLRPEIAPPARGRGLLAGVLLGGGAIAAAVLTGPSPLSTAGADGRGIVVGVGLAAGALIAGLRDHGRPLPENAAANARLRDEFAASVRQAREENARRLEAYRVRITIQTEAR
jgi:hypothetical protein